LKQKQFLETRYDRLDHRLYYRIQTEALDAIMEAEFPSEIRKADFGEPEPKNDDFPGEIRKPDFGKSSRDGGDVPTKIERREIRKPDFGNNSHQTTKPEKETTTTARAHAKAVVLVVPAPSSSFSFAVGGSEDPSGELTPQDRAELDQIALEFKSDGRQKVKAEACAKRRGMTFVRDQADIVRNDPKIRKLAAAFEKACDSPEGWQRPKAATKKPRRKPDVIAQPEQPPVAEPLPAVQEYAAEWQFWQEASEELRQTWLQDDFLRRWVPKPGHEPRRAFLARLHEMLPLAQQAACAATVLATPQQAVEAAA
jgi:hypothetical protein